MSRYGRSDGFKAVFEPVVNTDENVAVLITTGKWKYYKVDYIEALPPSPDLVVDIISESGETTIAAGGQIKEQSVDVLEVEEDEMAQVRFFPLDDVYITVNQPHAKKRHWVKNKTLRIDKLTRIYDPELKTTEIFSYEDDYPVFTVDNPGQYDIGKARIQFFGYKFIMTEMRDVVWDSENRKLYRKDDAEKRNPIPIAKVLAGGAITG